MFSLHVDKLLPTPFNILFDDGELNRVGSDAWERLAQFDEKICITMQVKRAASFEDGAFPHCLDGGGLRCAGRRFRNADAHVSWPRKRSASRLAFQPSFYLVLPGFHVFDVAAFQYAILFSFCNRVSSFFHFISFGLRSIRLLTKFYLVLPSFT